MPDTNSTTSFWLLTGEDLRVFLSQEAITVTLLRQILRHRGVFCSSTEKKDLLPFLLFSYLTPDEFELLIDAVRTREESQKYRTHTFTVPFEGATLADAMPVDLPIQEIAADTFNNYEIINVPMLQADTEAGKPSFVITTRVRRLSVGSDLTTTTRIFESTVRYTLDAKAKRLNVTTIHTSPETERVNRKLVSAINGHLKKQDFIEPNSEFCVRFNSFDNEERILFFMQFTALNQWNGLTFEKLKGLSLKLDDSLAVPDQERLAWMRKKVSRVDLNGEALQETFFVNDPTCRPFVIFWRMEMVFKFITTDHEGKLDVVFEFADYATSGLGTSEFQIVPSSCTIKGKSSHHPDCRDLCTRFMTQLNTLKQDAYDQVKQRNPTTTIS